MDAAINRAQASKGIRFEIRQQMMEDDLRIRAVRLFQSRRHVKSLLDGSVVAITPSASIHHGLEGMHVALIHGSLGSQTSMQQQHVPVV